MFNPISAIFFVISFLLFSFSISNGNPSADDKMLIDFVRGQKEMPISEYSKQKYEAHLGIMHFMRMNWQCDEIATEFEEYERTECQKYRKYLDILYEYLYREYAGIPTVKPKFVFKKQIEIDGPIIYAVNCLTKISQFYFNSFLSNRKKYKLNKLFTYKFEPKLLKTNRLNYELKLENEQKMPINEMILQLAIDTANEWQTNESANGIIRQKFDKNLEEMFKKAEEKAKEDAPWKVNVINVDKHLIILSTQFNDINIWADDALFAAFVKGEATNIEKFLHVIKKRWEPKEYFTQKFEAHLCVVHLMKKNWHCDKIDVKFKAYERTECQKYRKYLDILAEYLFRIYVEAKCPELVKQLPLLENNKLENINDSMRMNLINAEEINYEIEEEEKGKNPTKNKIATKIANLRKEFDQKMEKMCKKTKENVVKAKREKVLLTDEASPFVIRALDNEYDDKFGTFNSSPFS